MLLRILTNIVCCELKKIKTNLTMFLVFFWVFWFSQIIAISTMFLSLPDITEIPTVTVTDIPLEVFAPQHSNLDVIIIDTAAKDAAQERENRTVDILEDNDEHMQRDEQIIKFSDSGGDSVLNAAATRVETSEENIPSENENASGDAAGTPESESANNTNADMQPGTVNLTVEEVPIPVFSEWAQKQMEAAEKQQAKEQEEVNTSTQKKNHTNGNGKALPLKIRAKNYASPDCGAKIIASNADASNTGAVLSSSKDEYMLSPCGNRIWFVVELCEAIQAQKIELANFELFSSSPKNFTVAVSNRFPTRDWSNVGRFIAEDKRNIQSFELHPHLFGKFVRIDIHSHYSKEHFCPVSLFRVFGTSEFEAFETENHPNEEMDDFDDEFGLEQAHVKNSEPNLFKSASDAVLSMVKKAAEVLVKPTSNQNLSVAVQTQTLACRTPAFGQFNCVECNQSLVERINSALSCEFQQLNQLLNVERLRKDLRSTQVCAKQYGIETRAPARANDAVDEIDDDDCNMRLLQNPFEMDVKQSYFLNLLPADYVGALCQLLAEHQSYPRQTRNNSEPAEDEETAAVALNLTIDKKPHNGEFKIVDQAARKLLTPEAVFANKAAPAAESAELTKAERAELQQQATTEGSAVEIEQLPRPIQVETASETTTTTTITPTETTRETAPDVNIFNVPDAEKAERKLEASTEESIFEDSSTEPTTTTAAPTTTTEASTPKSDEDPSTWDSLDNLLVPTVATAGGAALANGGMNGVNLQQKIPSGPQSESVFIRLSNRIKALERNMSLSGQYLEELSRRYKKQVEELQLTLTQQTQTVRALEEQNRRHSELEQLYAQHNVQLKHELDELSLQVHACIVVIIFVGAFVFLVLMVAIVFYRAMRRETKELVALHSPSGGKRKAAAAPAANQKKLHRRKSYEDFSDKQQTPYKSGEKQRRPSEEAMLILKECGDIDASTVELVGDMSHSAVPEQQLRQRKVSVCYGCSNNDKRKGEKRSWPQTERERWLHLEQHLQAEQYDNFMLAETDNAKDNSNSSSNGQQSEQHAKGGKTKKRQHNLKRQESAPSAFALSSSYEPRSIIAVADADDYNNSSSLLLLAEEDLDNFLPNADLLYNEFMPDGPSGYQIASDACLSPAYETQQQPPKAGNKKSRRLSSPAFFKSPFSKGLKLKANTPANKINAPHESTSWEWYRLKKSEAQQKYVLTRTAATEAGLLRASPGAASSVASVDSASLSEINFERTNSTDNSVRWRMRVLEEAILSAGEGCAITATAKGAAAATTTATNGNSSQNSGSGSSNHSSTSSSSKKKKHTFNRFFRKVF